MSGMFLVIKSLVPIRVGRQVPSGMDPWGRSVVLERDSGTPRKTSKHTRRQAHRSM